jgi:hypothetical protein
LGSSSRLLKKARKAQQNVSEEEQQQLQRCPAGGAIRIQYKASLKQNIGK